MRLVEWQQQRQRPQCASLSLFRSLSHSLSGSLSLTHCTYYYKLLCSFFLSFFLSFSLSLSLSLSRPLFHFFFQSVQLSDKKYFRGCSARKETSAKIIQKLKKTKYVKRSMKTKTLSVRLIFFTAAIEEPSIRQEALDPPVRDHRFLLGQVLSVYNVLPTFEPCSS